MKLPDIRVTGQWQQLASGSGPRKGAQHVSPTVLIRKIQTLRGDEQCFATGKRYDFTEICQWRRSCRKLKAVWLR